MSFSYSLSTDVGKIRNLIGDTDATNALFSDEEISSLLSLNSSDLLMTAAMCLRRMAVNKGLLAKAISAGNYSENSSQVYKALLEIAKAYEERAISTPADAQVEVIYTDFNFNDILRNKSLRGEPLDG